MKVLLPFVSYEVTMTCNLKCRFCYNHYKNTGEIPKKPTYRQIDKTLRQIFKVFDISQITFTGGEPFTAERFGELVLTARLKGANVGIISNGNFAKAEDYIQIVKLGVKSFELPIHSYKSEIHDFMTRIEGSHQKSLSIISELQKNGITPTAVVVLTKYNCENCDETIRFIASKGINRIMINRYNIGGEGIKNPSELLPTKIQLQQAFKQISDEAQNLKLNITSNVCTPICVLNPKDYLGIRFSSCSFDISKRPITIDYLGNVRFCNHSPEILGNIFENSAEEIIKSPLGKKWAEIIPDYCKDCKDYSKCKAGCRASTQQCGLPLSEPDPIVKIYKNTNNE
ncbi:MAG: radical SAM protein [Bacteroidales bacterium]|nr:radical SAM protein [Bacteroidales bacterium]